MKKRLAALACHRRELLEKIEAQRRDVAEISAHLQKPLALVDAGIKAARFISSHPALVSGGVAAVLAWRSKDTAHQAEKKRWRLLYLYPSILFFGFKYLFSASRSPSADELLAGHTEERNTEVGD
jgi:hypothetical protein